jgi:hypothetical protein
MLSNTFYILEVVVEANAIQELPSNATANVTGFALAAVGLLRVGE